MAMRVKDDTKYSSIKEKNNVMSKLGEKGLMLINV